MLAVVSMIGIRGTWNRSQHRLRMYAFMLLVLILVQASIVIVIYDNLDSSFTDQLLLVLGSVCELNALDLSNMTVRHRRGARSIWRL